MSIAERISEARLARGWSQQRLANAIGTTRSACSQWESGRSLPNIHNLAQIAVLLRVPFEWLATGRGTRQLLVNISDSGNSSADEYQVTRWPRSISRQQQQLLHYFERLSSEGQHHLLKLLQQICQGSDEQQSHRD